MKNVILSLVILAGIFGNFAYPDEPVIISSDLIKSGSPYYFSQWKYHPGDNPDWADPNFDDRNWETVNSLLDQESPPLSGWNGMGWFRVRFQTGSLANNMPLVLLLSHWGASEIYINDEKIRNYGNVGQSKEEEELYVLHFRRNPLGYRRTPDAFPISLDPNTDYIMAVRYSNHQYQSLIAQNHHPGFELGIQSYDAWRQARNRFDRYVSFAQLTLPCIMIIMAALHLFLYIFYPRSFINAAFSITLFFYAITFYIDFSKFLSHDFSRNYFHIYFYNISYTFS
ncbi:MAG: hypothetical protein ACP5I1_11355, partial [Candidatus Hinthialibacter sp.]